MSGLAVAQAEHDRAMPQEYEMPVEEEVESLKMRIEENINYIECLKENMQCNSVKLSIYHRAANALLVCETDYLIFSQPSVRDIMQLIINELESENKRLRAELPEVKNG